MNTNLHKTDFYAWTRQQVQLLSDYLPDYLPD